MLGKYIQMWVSYCSFVQDEVKAKADEKITQFCELRYPTHIIC